MCDAVYEVCRTYGKENKSGCVRLKQSILQLVRSMT